MKKISQKLKWLKGIVHKSVTKNKDKSMYLACMGMMLFVEGLEEKTEKKEWKASIHEEGYQITKDTILKLGGLK